MMKLILSFCLMLLSCWVNAQSKNYVGIWEGKINVGITLRIAFHISQDASGKYASTMDSPDQSAFGMLTDYTRLKDDSIFVGIDKYKVAFAGLLVNDSTINGSFTQTASVPLVLKKVVKVTSSIRSQTPAPPFPYKTEEVNYKNKQVRIAGMLSYPNSTSGGKYPAILMITGSGPQNRDEEIMGHKPFAVIADYLTRKGFMVLRVDDRGTGESSGDFGTSTSADFAEDVKAGINFLKERSDVDYSKVGLLGHSEGAMIAQIVAAERKDINFLILMAGPGIKPIDLMTEQNIAVLKTVGITEKARNAYGPLYKSVALGIVNAKDSLQAIKKISAAFEQWSLSQDSSTLKQLGLATMDDQQTYLKNMHAALAGGWYKYFLTYDPAPNLKKVRAKVLAINGDKDIQVLAESNLAGLEANLKVAKADYEIHKIKNANHLFQTCTTCTLTEYGALDETISPEVLALMGGWLERKVLKGRQ